MEVHFEKIKGNFIAALCFLFYILNKTIIYTHGETNTYFYHFYRLFYLIINLFFATLSSIRDLSAQTRDWTCTPCLETLSLNHWTTREVSEKLIFFKTTLCQFTLWIWDFKLYVFVDSSWHKKYCFCSGGALWRIWSRDGPPVFCFSDSITFSVDIISNYLQIS